MADGVREDAWSRSSTLMALLYNRTCFDKSDKAKQPSDFNPYMEKKSDAILITSENVSDLKKAFEGF